MKRYVAEPGSETVRDLMARADGWFMCRVGFLETAKAVGLAGSASAANAFRDEWSAFGVVEVDQQLVERAAELAISNELRSLDALHLAAALVLPRDDLTLATWDRRMHKAALASRLIVAPDTLE